MLTYVSVSEQVCISVCCVLGRQQADKVEEKKTATSDVDVDVDVATWSSWRSSSNKKTHTHRVSRQRAASSDASSEVGYH